MLIRKQALEREALLLSVRGLFKMHSLKLNKMLTPTADPQVFLSHDSLASAAAAAKDGK